MKLYDLIDMDTREIVGYATEETLANDRGYSDEHMLEVRLEDAKDDGWLYFHGHYEWRKAAGKKRHGILL